MHRTLRWTSAAMIALTLSCSDDGQNPDDPAALLQDTWVATRWTYVSDANASDTLNFVEEGVSITLTIGAAEYDVEFTASGASDGFTGTYTVNGSSFVISDDGSGGAATIPFAFSNGNNTLTMSDPNTNWDFDDDGTDDPATLFMTFTRQ